MSDFDHIRKLPMCPICGDNKTPGTVTCWSDRCYSSPTTGLKYTQHHVPYLTWIETQLQFLADLEYARSVNTPTIMDMTPGDTVLSLQRLLKNTRH